MEELLSRQERAVRQAFAEFLRDAKSEATLREVRTLLERGDVEGALRVVDSYVSRMATTFPQILQDAARAEAAALAPALRELVPTVGIAFDPTNPTAARLAAEAKLQFIRQFTDEQRSATRQALIRSFSDGDGFLATARQFRDSIGLTTKQEAAVANYRALLEAGSREALSRELRDRRFDRSVERAARGGEPLSKDQIDRMTEAYRRRYLAYRSEMIARTEAVRLTSQGRLEAFRQSLELADLDPSRATHTWRAIRDKRTRHTHRTLDGQTKPLSQPFDLPRGGKIAYPGDPAAPADEVIGCRCHLTFEISGPA